MFNPEFDDFADDLPGCYVHDGDVYYDPRANRFTQLRERHEDRLVFSGECRFYEDAKTVTFIKKMPLSYLDDLEKVEDIEKFEKAECVRAFDIVFGWCVKREFEPARPINPF